MLKSERWMIILNFPSFIIKTHIRFSSFTKILQNEIINFAEQNDGSRRRIFLDDFLQFSKRKFTQ